MPAFASEQTWNFTPNDYQALVVSGGALRFEADSDWFPLELKENLLTVLNYVLNPGLIPSSTAGVNVKDFYHGHWACEKSQTLKRTLFGESSIFDLQDQFFVKRGLNWYSTVTEDNLKNYTDSIIEVEGLFNQIASRVLSEKLCENMVVVYHTFEASGPSDMGSDDPRRNLIVPFGDPVPTHFRPIDPSSASSWEVNYTEVFQFSFLIDSRGVVHVATGSTSDLSSVTGRPEQ